MKKLVEEKIAAMTLDDLVDEIAMQKEWLEDDEFELGSFNRGDGGAKRLDYIAKLEAERDRREQ